MPIEIHYKLLLQCLEFLKPSILSLKFDIKERFSCLRSLSDHINFPYIIGSFAAGTTNLLVAQN